MVTKGCVHAINAKCLLHAAQTAHMKEAAPASSGGALDPNEWRSFKVVSKETVTGNTSRLRYFYACLHACMQGQCLRALATTKLYGSRFATPNPDDTSGLFVASCLLTRAPIGAAKEDGTKKYVIRPYTPTSTVDAKGHFDLVRLASSAWQMSNTMHAKHPCVPRASAQPAKHASALQAVQNMVSGPDQHAGVTWFFASGGEGLPRRQDV